MSLEAELFQRYLKQQKSTQKKFCLTLSFRGAQDASLGRQNKSSNDASDQKGYYYYWKHFNDDLSQFNLFLQ